MTLLQILAVLVAFAVAILGLWIVIKQATDDLDRRYSEKQAKSDVERVLRKANKI